MLRKSVIQKAIDSSASPQNDIALPSGAGLCYSGMGIMFEVEGQSYPMTEANRQTFEEAVKSGKEISWTWSKTLSLKQGSPTTPTFEVRYLDTKARVIPELQITITK